MTTDAFANYKIKSLNLYRPWIELAGVDTVGDKSLLCSVSSHETALI